MTLSDLFILYFITNGGAPMSGEDGKKWARIGKEFTLGIGRNLRMITRLCRGWLRPTRDLKGWGRKIAFQLEEEVFLWSGAEVGSWDWARDVCALVAPTSWCVLLDLEYPDNDIPLSASEHVALLEKAPRSENMLAGGECGCPASRYVNAC